MYREMARLLVVNLGIAALAFATAWTSGGHENSIRCLIAFAITVPLAVICLGMASWSLGRSTGWQLGMTLGGSLGRSALTLAVGSAFYALLPVCKNWQFWLWIAAAYLITLVIEVVSLMGAIRQRTGSAAGVAVTGRWNETPPR
ncbi:MAG: hypothetical protein U1D30_04980 [Planctomycetota bacterium]